MAEPWRSIAARKQGEQRNRIPVQWTLPARFQHPQGSVLDIPRECGLLTTDEIRITERHCAASLVSHIANGKLKSEHVVRAFCKRAAIAHQLVNCLTEILFDDALVRAKELDDHLRRTGKPLGPLHGLPISLKDSFNIAGYDSSLGVASLCFQPAPTHSALVQLLLAAGAVVYCKTNVPQTLSALDSHNNVFGRTLNPRNRALTAGGSTGGEAALVALRGSPLGVGTDVGGSIRVPAACNLLYGVKPSHGRVPYAGQRSGGAPAATKMAIEPTAGPIAWAMRDCELFLRVVANSAPEVYDPDVIAGLSWAQLAATSSAAGQAPLRIGVIRTDGHVVPLPPITTLMDEVVSTLQSDSAALPQYRRVEVVELDVTSILSKIVKTFNGLMSVDGGNAWFDHLEATGEPLSPWLQGRLTRRPPKTADDILKLQTAKLDLQTQFLQVWRESGGHWLPDARRRPAMPEDGGGDRALDAIIMPLAPHPIPPIDRWNTVNYTAALNLLDLPTGVLPARLVEERDLLAGHVPTSPPLNGWDKVNRELWTDVDRRVYLGSALSVQVVAPRLMERKLVEVMTILDYRLMEYRARSVDGPLASLVSKM